MLGALSSLVWAAAVVVQPANTTCPSEQAITAELDRLGVLATLAELGLPEVTVEGTRMRVVFRGRDGALLGTREVAAPATCHERASTAAVFIAAWVGDWSLPIRPAGVEAMTSTATDTVQPAGAMPGMPEPTDRSALPVPVTASGSNATAPRDAGQSAAEAPPVSPTPVAAALAEPAQSSSEPTPHAPQLTEHAIAPARAAGAEVGAWALGTFDGDATALGAGVFARYRWARPLAIAALAETTGERDLAVGPAVAAYRTSRLGLGASLLHSWGALFLDAGLFPELTMLNVHGKQLAVGNTLTTWGAELDLRVRLGIAAGRIAPFVFLSGCGALWAQHLTLDGDPSNRTLSRWTVNAGVGMTLRFGSNE
jgi:hypothetical protein